MKSSTPKQFLQIKNKIVALYSFEVFEEIDQISEIIIVTKKEYRSFFKSQKPLTFAPPGSRRQDSVYNALKLVNKDSEYVCIHDGARPFIDKESILKVLEEGKEHKAAALGYKAINTIKRCDSNQNVIATLDRDSLYEIQTPQVIETNLLKKGYDFVLKNNQEVTDDVSIIEKINHKVKIVEGSKQNIKITTPFDLIYAKKMLL